MVALQNIRLAIWGFILTVALIVIFNTQLNQLADLINATEARLLIKASILMFIITVALLYPIGIGSRDMQRTI